MEQTATTCDVHDECIVITATDGADVVWTSHASVDQALDDRANDTYPVIVEDIG